MNVALVSQANTRQIGKRTKSLVEVNQKLTPLKLFSCILSFMPFIKGGKNSKRNCDDITRVCLLTLGNERKVLRKVLIGHKSFFFLSSEQVNAEIKRLLVASVGEDIGQRYFKIL